MVLKKSRTGKLKPSIKRLIYQRAVTKSQIPREFLANEIIKEVEELGEIPPSFETAKRYISNARNRRKPIDKPWSIACCSDYSQYFPPESIPFILECVQQYNKNYKQSSPEDQRKAILLGADKFSIRYAIWIVRLQPLVDRVFADEISKNKEFRLNYHLAVSMVYAISETLGELLGSDFFDSSELDEIVLSKNIPLLMTIALDFIVLKTEGTIQCNHNCEDCEYINILPGYCTKPRKETEI